MRTSLRFKCHFSLWITLLAALLLLLPTTAYCWGPSSLIITQRRRRRSRSSWPYSAPPAAATDASSTDTTTNTSKDDRDALLRRFVSLARQLGPVGCYQPPERQQELLDLSRQLQPYSDPAPARIPLQGSHSLVYSAAPGASSGKLWGPIYGQVTQEFLTPTVFRNKVQLGPLQLALTATREIISDTTIRVKFERTAVSLLDNVVLEKEIQGQGVWKYIFAGILREEGEKEGVQKLIRVFEAPNLFVVEQVLNE